MLSRRSVTGHKIVQLFLLLLALVFGGVAGNSRRLLADTNIPRSELELCVARHGEDTSYLDHLPYSIIFMEEGDGVEPHTVQPSAGKETPKYLAYIIETYEDLPEHVVFIHAEQEQWHFGDKLGRLRRLKWRELEYASLRPRPQASKCSPDDVQGCEWDGDWFHPIQIPDAAWSRGLHGLRDLRIERETSIIFSLIWKELYSELGPLPEVIHSDCCAEFVVSRERILARPKHFYEHLLAWILENGTAETTGPMEYMWASIFGEPFVSHPLTECELYTCEWGCSQDMVHCAGKPDTPAK